MIAYEIQIAHELRQQNNGKPRILPVRIDFEGSLPDPLRAILARFSISFGKDATTGTN